MTILRLRPPGVNVFQIFEEQDITIFTATLTPLLIGTARQIRTDKAFGVYAGNTIEIQYPDLLLTSTVDRGTVGVKIASVGGDRTVAKSPVVVQSTSGVTDASDGTMFSDPGGNFIVRGVSAGDVLVVLANGIHTPHTIASVVSATELVLSTGLSVGLTGVDYFIFKAGMFLPLERSVLIAQGIPYTGQILITYQADRADHTQDYMNVSSMNDLRQFFATEDIVPENPLPYAFMIAIANGAPGLTVRGLIVEEDSLASHNVALSYAGLRDAAWCFVPLTQRIEILQGYLKHVKTASEPLEKKERMAFISHKLITKDITLLRSGASTFETSSTGQVSAGTDVFTDTSVDFHASAVQIGDFVNILAPAAIAGAYPVDNIVSATQLSLTVTLPSTVTDITYEIVSNFFDASEIAENIQMRSMSYSNRRVNAIWPHEVDVPAPTGRGVVSVPSYYVGSAYAALAGSLPPQTPFSRMAVAGFVGLRYSNDFFTDEQLDMIAAGGTWIMVQNAEGANLECRHQLTTDTTTVDRREWNITKNVDFLAKTWRQTLAPLTGRNLITDNFLTQAESFAQSLINSAVQGGQLLASSSLTSVSINPEAPDSLDFHYRLDPPRPANTFNLYLVV